jgi:NitT/TauT family transport system permease protein
VIAAWFTLLNDGSLIRELLVSLQALSVGFLLAVLVGLGLGLAIGTLPDLDHLLEPYVSALLALPSVAYIPLIMLWLGFGLEARIAIVFEFAVLVIAINTRAGVLAVDRSLMEMGRSFGMTRQQLFTSIVLRAASPTIFAGLRIGIGRAVKGMVTAELLLVLVGLGGMIRYLGSSFRVDFLLAVVVTIVVVAMFMTAVLQSIDRRLNAWAVAVRP